MAIYLPVGLYSSVSSLSTQNVPGQEEILTSVPTAKANKIPCSCPLGIDKAAYEGKFYRKDTLRTSNAVEFNEIHVRI
jgi:hypothetical protein